MRSLTAALSIYHSESCNKDTNKSKSTNKSRYNKIHTTIKTTKNQKCK